MAVQMTFETAVNYAKNDIIDSINKIGQQYQLPTPILIMILNEIMLETKLASLSANQSTPQAESVEKTGSIEDLRKDIGQ